MENSNGDDLKDASENESLTPVRPPSEDIIKGARQDDAIKELRNNRSAEDIDEEEQHGTDPGAYPGPRDGE
ncbi:hypothetical protein ASE74_13175 [Pedobacter sp. Leaf216]|uniref:hypothetical protein n=1 Tax=Pedobacter sp. Leaf216 TaxID=1735684 RepID=UPI000701BD3F|nr:hypothetical protein [Pedobacter sp. Leaf216]KQM78450.1 hypothetical protein ASE74_13175 [Pedobacter sp. Leaf216]